MCARFDDELLERYTLGQLSEPECGPFEEHLLICPGCQERLHQTDRYIAAVRTVLAGPESMGPGAMDGSRFLHTLATSRYAQVLCGAGIVALSIFLARIHGGARGEAGHATLVSIRSGSAAIARTRAAPSLVLDLDTAFLPRNCQCRLQLVDHEGHEVATRPVGISGPSLRVTLNQAVAPGRYWVRLYGPSADDGLWREYGLEVE